MILRVANLEITNMVAHVEEIAINSPTAWFAVLESARLRGNREREAEAIRQLGRLGVEVRFFGQDQAITQEAAQ